jgi:hypothetical protein
MRIVTFLCSLLLGSVLAWPVLAQTVTPAQATAIRAGVNAETDPVVVAARAIRDDQAISAWCNGASATDAWLASADRRTLFEAIDVTKFDALTAGKRDAFKLMMDNAPLDFGRNKMRSALVDVWGATDSVAVLTALREKATRCQMYVGGTSRTTNTVTGLDRGWAEQMSGGLMSSILNAQQ